MFLWNDGTYSTEPFLKYTNFLFTKRLHFLLWSSNLRANVVSSSAINILPIIRPKSEPWQLLVVFIPSFCVNVYYKKGNSVNLDINLIAKWETHLLGVVKSFLISDIVNIFVISWSSKIHFIIISMVYSGRTEVKRDFTWNDTMLLFLGVFSFSVYFLPTSDSILKVNNGTVEQ